MASSSTNVTDKSNTLSSVVSNLVRASMGTSLSPTVTDEDLDRHVAELILKEAKKKAEKYSQQGIRAYIASNLQDSNAPRTNKRFLSSIIRSTDDHNKAILKAQAEAAEEIKRARREEEKRERRARAEEAVRARVSTRRRSRHSPRRRSWREDQQQEEEEGGGREEEVEWDRWNGRVVDRTEDRKKRKMRSWETVDVDNVLDSEVEAEEARRSSRRRRGREREEEDKERQSSRGKDREDRDRHRSRRKHEDEGVEDRRRRRHRSRSASPRRRNDRDEDRDGKRLPSSRRHRSRSYSPRRSSDKKERRRDANDLWEDGLGENDLDDHDRHDRSSVSKVKEDNPSTVPSSSHTPLRNGHKRSRSRSRSRSSRLSPKSKHSKHSKPTSRYSSPARSISPTSRSLPSPGPSPPLNLPSKMDKYFEESYDPRLDITPLNPTPHIPSTGLITDADFEGWDAMLELIRLRREDKEDRKRLERLGLVDKTDKKGKAKEKGGSGVATSTSLSGGNLLEIEYKKRGSVREWDLGKEGVDLSF